MPEPHLVIAIPDKSFGFVSGQRISIDLHVIGLDKQTVEIRFALNDPLGATRLSFRDVDRDLDGGHTVLPFHCNLEPDFPPGAYLVTAQVLSELQNTRAIATESFEVVAPGRRLSDGFPVAPRDCIVDASCTFEPVDPLIRSRRRFIRPILPANAAATRTGAGARIRTSQNPRTAGPRMSPWVICTGTKRSVTSNTKGWLSAAWTISLPNRIGTAPSAGGTKAFRAA